MSQFHRSTQYQVLAWATVSNSSGRYQASLGFSSPFDLVSGSLVYSELIARLIHCFVFIKLKYDISLFCLSSVHHPKHSFLCWIFIFNSYHILVCIFLWHLLLTETWLFEIKKKLYEWLIIKTKGKKSLYPLAQEDELIGMTPQDAQQTHKEGWPCIPPQVGSNFSGLTGWHLQCDHPHSYQHSR